MLKFLYGLLYLNFGLGTVITLILQMSNLRLKGYIIPYTANL